MARVELDVALEAEDWDAEFADDSYHEDKEGCLQATIDCVLLEEAEDAGVEAPTVSLLAWRVVQQDRDEIVLRCTIETSDVLQLRRLVDDCAGPHGGVLLWVEDQTQTHNPVWPANLGHGELSEAQPGD